MWELKDLSSEVLADMERKIHMGLEACGMEVEGNVAELVPVDTGHLKSTITHEVDGHTIVVGTNVEYAQAVELRDNATHAVGQAHYMRDGIQNSKEICKEILSAALRTH